MIATSTLTQLQLTAIVKHLICNYIVYTYSPEYTQTIYMVLASTRLLTDAILASKAFIDLTEQYWLARYLFGSAPFGIVLLA